MKSRLLLKFALLFISVITILACSDDRTILDEINEDDIQNKEFNDSRLISIFSNETKKQKFTVNKDSDLPITTPKGTKLWIYPYNLLNKNTKNPTYPYNIELIELYTLKDMLLYNKPTSSFSSMLTTAGAIYLNVVKDNENLTSNTGYPPSISIPSKKVDNQMWLFYQGNDRNDFFTWIPSDTIRNNQNQGGIGKVPSSPIIAGKSEYQIFPQRFGWINCDRFLNSTKPLTQVRFTSKYPNLDAIVIFMLFPDIQSVIRVFDGLSLQCPIGESVKIVAIAETKDKEYYSFFKEIKVEDKQTIPIQLKKTTEQEFLDAVEQL